jgi:hypothetical protein
VSTKQKKMADPYEHQTVSALINTLKQLPPDSLVVMSTDSEGNTYQIIDGIDTDPETTFDTNDDDLALVEHEKEFVYERHDKRKGIRRCIVMYPEDPR